MKILKHGRYGHTITRESRTTTTYLNRSRLKINGLPKLMEFSSFALATNRSEFESELRVTKKIAHFISKCVMGVDDLRRALKKELHKRRDAKRRIVTRFTQSKVNYSNTVHYAWVCIISHPKIPHLFEMENANLT